MKKSNITNLNIFGITPETENNIPSQITDLDDGATIIESITSLENNKQDNLSFEQLEAINSGITAGKIMQSPYTTSELNPLVNQEFVNSSIATNTANFIGTFSNIVDLENYSGTLTNNDYAFVTNKVINSGNAFDTFNDMISYVTPVIDYVVNYDYAFIINADDNTKIDVYRYDISQSTIAERWGENNPVATAINIDDFQKNPAYNRYKYTTEATPAEWRFEYTLNNSSFTASQWAAINSGITTNQVSQIAANTQAISNKADTNNVIALDTTTQTFDGDKKLELGWDKKVDFGFENESYKGDLELVGFNSNYSSPTITFKNGKYSPKTCTISLSNVGSGNHYLKFKGVSGTMDVSLPNVSGTIAMTSNIPTFLTFSNTSVAQADWVADNTYTGYDYKATLTLTGVTADMIPQVVYGADEAVSGNYLPIAESYAGGIYIYSKVDTAIIIPTIILQKAGA